MAHDIAAEFWGARYIAATDLTGDGLADLVVSTVDISGNGMGLYWFRNRNAGASWAGPSAVDPALQGVETTLVHDVDGDGVTDVIAVGRSSGQVAWYENRRAAGSTDGTLSFTKHLIASVAQPNGLALARPWTHQMRREWVSRDLPNGQIQKVRPGRTERLPQGLGPQYLPARRHSLHESRNLGTHMLLVACLPIDIYGIISVNTSVSKEKV